MRRDTVKYIALLFCLTLVIPFLSGCNDTDDVQKIFTGKTWKMTYITKKNEHSWYKFTDVSEAIYKSYDPINGTKHSKYLLPEVRKTTLFAENSVEAVL